MKRTWWRIRLAAKWFWGCVGRSWRLIEYCKQCGRRQPVYWHAPDDLWLEITGSPYGVFCPECFDRWAGQKGILLKWTCEKDTP